MKNKNNNYFDTVADTFYTARQHINHITFKNLMWAYFFKDKNYLKSTKPINVLEPMCGYADGKTILENTLGISIIYEGFDLSDNQIIKAKNLDPNLNIYKQDILNFIPEKEYDIILIIGGLMYIPDKAPEIIKKLNKAIKNNGFFINYEPTHNNFLFKLIRNQVYKQNSLFNEQNERDFSLSEYNNMFKTSSFKLVDQIYPGLLCFILYFNPDAFPFLNIGKPWLVKFIFNIEKVFFRSFIGKKLSFATITIWQKEFLN